MLMSKHPNDLLYMSRRDAGLGLQEMVSIVQWRKLGILYRIVQRDMPSRDAGLAVIEREISSEAVPLT